MSAKTLKHVALDGHSPTGRTRHAFRNVDVGPSTALRIVQYDEDPGFYLIHSDANGREIADTYHETIDDAMAQAEWEFGIRPEEWQNWVN